MIINIPPVGKNIFQLNAGNKDLKYNLYFSNAVISTHADNEGMGGWTPVSQLVYVNEVCDYITIGIFNNKDLNNSSNIKTAYFIDDVHISEVPICPCTLGVNNSGLEPEASVDVKIIHKENCCFEFFFHNKLTNGCQIQDVHVDVTIQGHPEYHHIDTHNCFPSPNDFITGSWCLPPLYQDHNVVFKFGYHFYETEDCEVEQVVKLSCPTSCPCPIDPNPISIVPIPTEPCCYNILLKMNNDNELTNFCRYYKAEVYDKDDFGYQPYNKLFEVYPDPSNSFIQGGIRYFYPGMEINLTAARKLCYDARSFPYKSIKIRLYSDEVNYCEYESGIGLNCPISCGDIPNPTPIVFLKCIWIPTPKGPLVTKCKYELHVINNTGLNVTIPEFKYDFSSINDTLPEFQRSWLTNFDSIAVTLPTSPTDWTFLKDSINQSISFTTSPNEFVLDDGDTLHLADISIPESDEAVAVGFSIKNAQDLNSYCDFGEEIISCPQDSVCSCEASSLFDFTLTAKEKETASDPCCYEITLSPPSQYLNCAINEIEVYVKNPNDTIYSLIPDIDTLLLTPLNNKITLSQDICITPDNGNSSFSVKVKFKNLNYECVKEKTDY
ncbi:MAG: hypothetical protein WCR42_11410, partial [bacterium]